MQKGIKVLFVYPNPAMDNLIPVGLSLLSAFLKRAGHQVKLFDCTFYDSGRDTGESFRERYLQVIKTDFEDVGIRRIEGDIVKDFRKAVEEYKPDIVGATAIEISYSQALKLLKEIEDMKMLKIFGGVHVMNWADDVLAESCIDVVCVGEGEEAIVDLADAIRDNKDYSNIKNLWVKKDGKIIKNELRPLQNIDNLPFQDWSIYDDKRLYKPYLGKIVRTGGIEGQRGCVGRCTFCCNPTFRKLYKRKIYQRFREPEKIIKEVLYLKKKYNLQFIKFLDPDLFARDNDDFKYFAEVYKKTGPIPFWAEGRVDFATQMKVSLLEEMGCMGFAYGVESGNEFIRNKVLGKFVTDKQIRDAIMYFKKTNLKLTINSMIGNPYESRKEIFETIELNRWAVRENKNVRFSVSTLSPYGNTHIRKLCIREGFIDKDVELGNYMGEWVLNLPTITKKELIGLYRTFPLYVMFPRSMFHEIEKAETNDKEYERLGKIYSKEYLR